MKQQSKMSNKELVSVRFCILIGFLGFLMLFVVCSVGIAEDWPTYRSQITRSGISSETVEIGRAHV